MAKKELTKRQNDALKRHSKHHTKKHMDFMVKKMMSGSTFGQSDKLAMKKVGS